jgi:hypothetical protein
LWQWLWQWLWLWLWWQWLWHSGWVAVVARCHSGSSGSDSGWVAVAQWQWHSGSGSGWVAVKRRCFEIQYRVSYKKKHQKNTNKFFIKRIFYLSFSCQKKSQKMLFFHHFPIKNTLFPIKNTHFSIKNAPKYHFSTQNPPFSYEKLPKTGRFASPDPLGPPTTFQNAQKALKIVKNGRKWP